MQLQLVSGNYQAKRGPREHPGLCRGQAGRHQSWPLRASCIRITAGWLYAAFYVTRYTRYGPQALQAPASSSLSSSPATLM